ncbi:ATP-dependent zinc metalloprotease FtsH [Telmatospirillum sp. J64-1]|uniref:ATP-dependent zinc metalloprotease FtsH n=1 Tax=Telmatospirillum sp. J64-1 TaxID=2502183 RepID=UPI002107AEC5|nr:ATP-dependent zinc metalloprotease FtsH [Telmatospirillum sp. J64-1]
MNNRKRLVIAALVALGLLGGIATSYPLYSALTSGTETEEGMTLRDSSYSQVVELVRAGEVETLTFYGMRSASAAGTDNVLHRTLVPELVAADLARQAADAGVTVEFKSEEFLPYGESVTARALLAVVGNLLIFGFLGAFFYFYVLRGPMAGRSKVRQVSASDSNVRFADVAGCDAEKEELMEVVQFLRDPQRFSRLGGTVPTGVLMSGPPGTGKTLLAKAVAGEAGVPFFSASGSDFVEMYVGVGAGRVRSMFAKAKKKAPCILFIDEIDAVGRSRSTGTSGGAHEEREQTLNQLLVEMDGFGANSGVIVIAATNRPEILDAALTRPGRFSRNIVLQNPDIGGREKILAVHCAKVRLAADADLHVVARGTPGFSGADLANLVNEAAIMAARSNRDSVTMADFDHAKDRLIMGNERRSFVLSEEDRRLTAYHEAGHALVAHYSPASDPIHKVTIVPRGQSLGMVVRIPERDQPSLRRSRLLADLAVAMGGRAAEELIFGPEEITTGASGDIQMASRIARKMVAEWGMSERVGTVAYTLNYAERDSAFSEDTTRQIDAEVKALVAEGRDRALHILTTRMDQLHELAQALLERESLSGAEIKEMARNWPASVEDPSEVVAEQAA